MDLFKDLSHMTHIYKKKATNQSLSINCFLRISFHIRRIYHAIIQLVYLLVQSSIYVTK